MKLLILSTLLSISCLYLTACPLVRGTGNAVEAIGDGVGDAVSGTGEAIGETGRELATDPLH
jgi:predicted small secreted protein